MPHLKRFDLSETNSEAALAICLARLRLTSSNETLLRHLSAQTINWRQVLSYLTYHGTLPLFAVHLNALEKFIEVPLSIRLEIINANISNSIRNIYLSSQLCEIHNLFATNDIRVLPFKGASLAVAAYRDVARRRFTDLDVLISPKDLAKASCLLINEGFVADGDLQLTPSLIKDEYHLSFRRTQDACLIELHWQLFPRYFGFATDFNKLFKRSAQQNIPGGTVQAMSAEDSLITLSLHGAKHGWSQLNWLCDISELLKRHEKNLNEYNLIKFAVELRAETSLRLAFTLARDVLDAPLTENLKAWIAQDESRVNAVSKSIQYRLKSLACRDLTYVELFKFHLRLHNQFSTKLAYTWRVGFNQSIADKEVSSTSNFVASLKRPWRLLRRYAATVALRR